MDDTRFGGRSVALELLIPRSFTLARETPLQPTAVSLSRHPQEKLFHI